MTKPFRYIHVPRRRSLYETLIGFLRTGKWRRIEYHFEPIAPEDPRYEDAPYEMGVIWSAQSTEPWNGVTELE